MQLPSVKAQSFQSGTLTVSELLWMRDGGSAFMGSPDGGISCLSGRRSLNFLGHDLLLNMRPVELGMVVKDLWIQWPSGISSLRPLIQSRQ